MTIRYEQYDGLPPAPVLDGLLRLHQRVFVGQSTDALLREFTDKQNQQLLTLVALTNEQVVGYKMGYPRKPDQFYSWLGCVDPDYRGQGIASELMQRQHAWCQTHHYQSIRTHTRNQWRQMLILNIRHGFDIIGTIANSAGHLTIVLEKRL